MIAVARTLVNDNEFVEVETLADAEQIILSSIGDNGNVIDDKIGEPSEIITANKNDAPTCKGYEPKLGSGTPSEEDIDNPAGWSTYTFTPTYDKNNNYLFHSTLTAAKVVPLNEDGKLEVARWEFHFQSWQGDDKIKATYSREGASLQNLKSASGMGCLNVNVLKKHGLTVARV